MKIEDEIRQKAFITEFAKLNVNLLFTGSWVALKNTQALRPFGITPQQFNVLRILRGQLSTPCTVQTISERMLDKTSNASRLVDKLVEKGMADRKTCPKDRRAVDILITQKGLDLLADAEKTMNEFELQYHTLSKQEARQLNVLLDKVRG